MDERQINNSVVKAFSLLECFSSGQTEWGVTELAREINSNKSTVYRLLTTLEKLGAIRQNPDNEKYNLGLKLFELGNHVPINQTFLSYTHPAIEQVAASITETVHIGVLKEGKVFYVDKVESPLGLKISTQIGSFRPSHCTGLGKVLLAYASPEQVDMVIEKEGLASVTKHSITSKKALLKELEQIRSKGYALDREEFEIGLICLAIPVFNNKGEVIAGLSASGPSSRFREEAIDEYVAKLEVGASAIKDKIGNFNAKYFNK